MAVDYQTLLDKAMLGIVKTILIQVQEEGLKDDQYFYISFRTDFPGVILSGHVKQRYPKEITIVLQHQFKNLRVLPDKFSINISFGGVAETVEVPFSALTSFVDPIADFNLQFKRDKKEKEAILLKPRIQADLKQMTTRKLAKVQVSGNKSGEVIALDKFRKKQEENKII
jgi:hypothetical protein